MLPDVLAKVCREEGPASLRLNLTSKASKFCLQLSSFSSSCLIFWVCCSKRWKVCGLAWKLIISVVLGSNKNT
ncbi:hypothetical protein O181_117326 [Austropuccinia psidii MF-1]|uniref:Uncharacterized protein n=1 Tax=Austropuccinia psidii MF-1 TaxID=1389203 RepID=A0A9Q3PXU4_9BASI|nr:hypothetical protein [Austropuccinia psidii MF-1]